MIGMQLYVLIILLIILSIGYFYLNKYLINSRFGKKFEVVFYLNEHKASEPDKIPETLLLENEDTIELTYNMWLYFDGVEYKWGSPKHILTKGPYSKDNIYDVFPSLWLSSDCKDINVALLTDSGLEAVKVSNIPIYKWFMLSLVFKEQTIEIYLDGKLERTYGLKGWIKMVPGDLWLTQDGGYSGKMQNVRIFANALKPIEIEEMYKHGRDVGLKFNFLPTQGEIATMASTTGGNNKTRPTGTPSICINRPTINNLNGNPFTQISVSGVEKKEKNNGYCPCPPIQRKTKE